MDTETEVCLALAKAYDTEDLRCPPHTHSNNTKAKSPAIVKGAPKQHFRDIIVSKLTVMYELINEMPLSEQQLETKQSRSYLIHQLGCELYELTKANHKESFFSAQSLVMAEPHGTSLTS